MKKFFCTLVVGAILATSAVASNAISVFLGATDTVSGLDDWANAVTSTDGNGFSGAGFAHSLFPLLGPNSPGLGETNVTEFVVPPPSGLVYIDANQSFALGKTSMTFTNVEADFDVLASQTSVFGGVGDRRFKVLGKINGTVTTTTTSAFWRITDIIADDGGPAPVVSAGLDPITGLPSKVINFDLSGGAENVTLWLGDFNRVLSKVSSFSDPDTSEEGAVSSVPEPSVLTLLVSTGVVGSIVTLRRRSRK